MSENLIRGWKCNVFWGGMEPVDFDDYDVDLGRDLLGEVPQTEKNIREAAEEWIAELIESRDLMPDKFYKANCYKK